MKKSCVCSSNLSFWTQMNADFQDFKYKLLTKGAGMTSAGIGPSGADVLSTIRRRRIGLINLPGYKG